jgi:hypothetical protein
LRIAPTAPLSAPLPDPATHRHGRHAGEHVVAAARAIYNRAIADDLTAAGAPLSNDVLKATSSG